MPSFQRCALALLVSLAAGVASATDEAATPQEVVTKV